MNKKLDFTPLTSVNNPNSIHGIYPYRGKISAVDAETIISQLPTNGTLLDPFCGSGTIVYEAQQHGFNAIGVDNNPLAVKIAKAKTYKKSDEIISECEEIISNAKNDLKVGNYSEMPDEARRSFHIQTSKEIMCVKNYYEKMNDFIKGVFFGAIALTARGCNGYVWTSSSVGKNIEPKIYIDFFEKFISKLKKHIKYLSEDEKGNSQIIEGDSRKLSDYIKPKSVDFVFSSPPYFDALDYTAYYGKLIYDIFSIDRIEIKQNLIQHISSYESDMRQVLDEIDKVTKDDAIIIFVVGDKKVKNKIINGGEFFSSIKPASYIIERNYTGTSSQVFDKLNNTDRKEQIVVWDKKKGEIISYE